MSETLDLFKAALGLAEPWRVTRSDFDVAQADWICTWTSRGAPVSGVRWRAAIRVPARCTTPRTEVYLSS